MPVFSPARPTEGGSVDMAVTRWLHGGYMVVTWWLHGGYMVRSTAPAGIVAGEGCGLVGGFLRWKLLYMYEASAPRFPDPETYATPTDKSWGGPQN